MIECYNHKIWKNKRKFKGKKRVIILFVILAIFTLFFLFYKFVVSRQVFSVCYDYCYKYSTLSVNEATLISLDNSIGYNDLISIEKNNIGDISLMSANSLKINSISRKIENETAKILEKKLNNGIPIPILSFFGLNILSGYGTEVYFNSLTVSSVSCSFKSNFNTIGINQTMHQIYVEITCKTVVEIPFSREEIIYSSEILISEAVLVGKVPEVYLKGNLFS